MTRTDPLLAAGTVLWRGGNAGRDLEVALVHRPRYDDWSLPKGKVDPGEHLAETAVRETREETGSAAALGRALPTTTYDVSVGRKRVHYWAGEALEGAFQAGREVDAVAWLSPARALRRLTHLHDRAPVEQLVAGGPTTTVLLVRHGRAGDRAGWAGDDRDRPLDPRGEQQAMRLARVLACWRPTRVLSADRARCVQTLQPLAQDLGVPVEVEPAWSDEVAATQLDLTVGRLRSLAAGGGTVAVCSQGGAVPAVVAALGAADRVAVRTRRGRPPARKGSTWVLSLRGGQLVAADYLPDAAPALPA